MSERVRLEQADRRGGAAGLARIACEVITRPTGTAAASRVISAVTIAVQLGARHLALPRAQGA